VVLRSFRDYLREMFFHNPCGGLVKSTRAVMGHFPAYIDSPDKRHHARVDGTVVLLWLAIMVAFTLVSWRTALAAYWGPLLFFSSMVRLSALPEHWGCAEGPDVHRSTRSIRSNVLVRTVLWNGNFHVEHHMHPGVPSCNLPKLNRRLQDKSIRLDNSYIRFHLRLLRELTARRLPVADAPHERESR
jgi:fatty acid desaturase